MNEKKTVLFLMNGLGVESAKSFEIYSKEIMPTFDKLTTIYPFKKIYSKGKEASLNEEEISNFDSGYSLFGSLGHRALMENTVNKKINSGEFRTNRVINSTLDSVVDNKKKLHVYFSLGDRINETRLKQFIEFCELCENKKIDKIYLHFIIGDNSCYGSKNAIEYITMFKNKVLRFYKNIQITSICGINYFKNETKNDVADYYRMQVSGVGEIWGDYVNTINKKYDANYTDDNMNGFITIKENFLQEGDAIFFFNYDNQLGKKYIDVVLNPKKYFPTVNCPENIFISSLFPLDTNGIPFAFQNELVENSFLDRIPEDKKVLIIASEDRIAKISKYLNGDKTTFNSNISAWPITDSKRIEKTGQYLAAYINQGNYDLIIADYELYNYLNDSESIEKLKENLHKMDDALNITYTSAIDNDYRLIVTSLYGVKKFFQLEARKELVDLSSRTPFLLIDKEIRKQDIVFKKEGSIVDVSRLIAISYGNTMPNNLIRTGTPEDRKSNLIPKIVIGTVIILLVGFVLYFLYIMGYIG